MQIFVSGEAKKAFAPDQIIASADFSFHAKTYQEALADGVKRVQSYIQAITENTDFAPEDFRTTAYTIREHFIVNRIEAKTAEDLDKKLEKRISDGFYFTQNLSITFDYDRERLAKLMTLSSRLHDAPALHFYFGLKDPESKRRELIGLAYEAAHLKAEALATAANKNLRDCVRVDIDQTANGRSSYATGAAFRGADTAMLRSNDDFENTLKAIDETFKPDNITLSKRIDCVWETSN